MPANAALSQSGKASRFKTTHWSLISSSVDGPSAKAHEALTQLCRTYWRPIFAYLCRNGHSVQDAQDLTQDFFVMVLRRNLLEQASLERGRFRTLLLTSLQNFLIDVRDKAQAIKRGGEVNLVSWDQWIAEAPSHLALPTEAIEDWPAEKIFDVRWAATVVEQALRRLQEECEVRGRRRLFDVLSGSLMADRNEISYESLARELGSGTGEIRRALNSLRQRYRQLLREEVAKTVEREADIDEELRYLVSALSAGNAAAVSSGAAKATNH